MPSAKDIKEWLKLEPNPQEGGFLASVYQSSITVPDKVLEGISAHQSTDAPFAARSTTFWNRRAARSCIA